MRKSVDFRKLSYANLADMRWARSGLAWSSRPASSAFVSSSYGTEMCHLNVAYGEVRFFAGKRDRMRASLPVHSVGDEG